MDSNNPIFNERTLEKMRANGALTSTTQSMTVEGAINKVGLLTVMCIGGCILSWSMAESQMGPMISMGSILVGFVLAMVIIFKKEMAPTLAPIYAVVEGLALGYISFAAEQAKPGVVMNAFIATFGILLAMIVLYRFRIIRATERFKIGMSAALIGVLITYVADFVLGLFGHPLPFLHDSSTTGMLVSGVVIVIASLCFILDFDMIETAAAQKAPKWMEWYAGFSVLMTLIWLYLEILRFMGRRK